MICTVCNRPSAPCVAVGRETVCVSCLGAAVDKMERRGVAVIGDVTNAALESLAIGIGIEARRAAAMAATLGVE